MLKRVFSAFLLMYMGLHSILSPVLLYAVSTNGVASPWTREKAEHLARKALLWATPTAIDSLFAAGSASLAVDLLFPDAVGPDRTTYNAEVSALTSSGFNFGNEGNMRKLYQLRYYRDPYEAKVKLFSLFEDIFPANQSDKISYLDIKNQHDLIYANTLGNYQSLVKRILFNNGQPGDYAEGKFLDLLDQSNKNSPNENYARELLQLFLMGEYKPSESKEFASVRNYEESDVAALAKILTGLESDPTTHLVSYDATKHNTSTGVLFLTGVLSSNPFSSFYDSASGTLDLGSMQTSLMGNNGLTDNAIDYIFAQRSEAISLFLADRLFRFYIHEKPTRTELDAIAANIRSNGFEMLPSVKSLLGSDILYSDISMNTVSYKNPLELAIGTLKILHDRDPLTLDPRIYDTELLNMLNWRPYFPGSVFGREGFDSNAKWFTAYTENQWISFSTRLASVTTTGSYLLSNINPVTAVTLSGSVAVSTSLANSYTGTLSIIGTGNIVLVPETPTASGVSLDYSGGTVSLPDFTVRLGSGVLSIDQGVLDMPNSLLSVSSGSFAYSGQTYSGFSGSFAVAIESLARGANVDEILTNIENSVLSSRRLPESVKAKIRTYAMTSATGAVIPFTPSLPATQNTKIRGMVALALASPEFILQTGFDVLPITEAAGPSAISSTPNKLVFIELSGGYDWLHGVIQKDQYPTYQSLRTNTGGTIAIAPGNLTDLGDFYMNNALAFSWASGPSLKSLYDSNNLRIFNRVGTFKHSRDHDAAQKQSTSYGNTTFDEEDGAFGHIIKAEAEGSNTISLSGKSPNIFRNGNFINIGPSGAQFTNHAPISALERTSQLNLFRDVFATRDYPGTTKDIFKNAARIDEVATASVSRSGPSGAGYGNVNNFAFLRSLLSSWVGKTFYMQGDGGYDTHSAQLAASSNFDPNNIPRDLNYNVGKVMANATAFFNSVKDTQNITIVIYSEFGRTIRVNGDLGTDHGQGGGMFVISNNPTLQSNLPNKVYGSMDLLREKSDWLGVGLDYRSVYGKIYNALYGLSDSAYFTSTSRLETDMDIVPPKFALARNEFRPGYNSNNARLVVPFRMEDQNFSMDYGSNLEIEYGTGFSSLKKLNQWNVDRYVRRPDGSYLFDVGVFQKNTPYVYRIRAVDNQLRHTVLTGSLNIPDIRLASSTGTTVSTVADTIVNAHANRMISGSLPLSGNASITLANNWSGSTSTVAARDWVSIDFGTGVTRVDSLSAATSATWNGGYILGEMTQKDSFLSAGSLTNTGVPLSSMNIEKIVKVGADTLGVQMHLSQPVVISVSGMASSLPYSILRSEDGMSWAPIATASATAGILQFPTSSFSYFALVSTVPIIVTPPVIPPVVAPPTPPIGGSSGGGGGGISRDYCPSGDYSPSYYDRTCGTKAGASTPSNTTTPNTIATPNSTVTPTPTPVATPTNNSNVAVPSSGVFGNNPVIRAYAFPENERIPQNVASELNFIITKIARVLDKKAGSNELKKARYYQTVDAYIISRANKARDAKEKRIFEYLHIRFVTVSKGLLSMKVPTAPTVPRVSVPEVAKTPDVIPASVTPIVVPSLWIDLGHPALASYDFTQDKRMPKTVTNVLDGFADLIMARMDAEKLSVKNRELYYRQLLAALEARIQKATEAKERKVMQYVRNRIYIRQQEEKMYR